LRLAAYLHGERHEVPLSPTLTSENFLFLREAILKGLGVGLVPDYVVQDAVSRGDVVSSLDDWKLSIFGTRMFMLYMPNRHHTRAASTFIEYVLDKARHVPGTGVV
jgi:DNA-binding transcriptional LysR family regulator